MGYKHTYCTSAPCFIAKAFIIFLPCSVMLDIMLSILGHTKVGAIIGIVLFSFLSFAAAGLLFMILATLLINCFKDTTVMLNESTIAYNDIILDLDAVAYITLYLPKTEGRFLARAQALSLYISDKEHIVITRPSIALIAHLKKRCKNAKFEIDEIKARIKTDLMIGVCVAAIVLFLGLVALI